MDQNNDKDFEIRIEQAAKDMRYPPTPDIATAVLQQISVRKTGRSKSFPTPDQAKRWLAPALALLIVIILTLSLVPGVRAQFLEFLQVGPLRIFFTTPTPSSFPAETIQPPPASLLDLAGQTTLSDARNRWKYPIRVPTYPDGLGDPDLVFLQGPAAETLILVWLDPTDPNQVYLALQALAPGESRYSKSAPTSVEQTVVNGDEAYWIVGEHMLEMQTGDFELVRFIEGHVLAWSNGELTYRLESSLSMEEAVRIAESLR